MRKIAIAETETEARLLAALNDAHGEIERLRAALQRIADENWSPKLTEIAIRALKDKP